MSDQPQARRIIYSGTCLCGHSWREHHLSMVLDPEVAAVIGDSVPGACLKYGGNECEGLDEYGHVHCNGYVDAEDAELAPHWKGTKR